MTATQSGTFDGVYIEHAASPAQPTGAPIVFVHGGAHGSWVWDRWLPYFAATGRHCYSFSWFGHTGSRDLPDRAFAARTQADTVEELEIVVAHVGQTPVMIAHSMGATVVQKYAEQHATLAQVLLAPSICAEVGVIDAQIHFDLDAPVEPPPFDLARDVFLGGCTEEDARCYHALLTRESPTAMKQATLAETSVDRIRIGGPSLMVAAEHDVVVLAEAVRRSAAHFGSDYLFLAGRSHNIVLEPRWRETADRILAWLNHHDW
ncbi:alpha/beta hydrolase [Mycobacterium sp. AZCC_0083]|uniref:alpha/beta hydrolase n=1 Tax=Mycobacterium sp. AZCC_0083 TaxID=2735882 RepID=UPI0016109B98|nr:alpha/beta fold hydrolase [Mycobacterium sp. AZCC_0083]MBB5167639.1 pimeloyl-ACP methyl ester carboxylesterase [Mycobacterium sp. AZCC_0083]